MEGSRVMNGGYLFFRLVAPEGHFFLTEGVGIKKEQPEEVLEAGTTNKIKRHVDRNTD